MTRRKKIKMSILCSSHCKLKKYESKKGKNVKKNDNHMLEQGKNIVKILDKKNNFLDVDSMYRESARFKESNNEIYTDDNLF